MTKFRDLNTKEEYTFLGIFSDSITTPHGVKIAGYDKYGILHIFEKNQIVFVTYE